MATSLPRPPSGSRSRASVKRHRPSRSPMVPIRKRPLTHPSPYTRDRLGYPPLPSNARARYACLTSPRRRTSHVSPSRSVSQRQLSRRKSRSASSAHTPSPRTSALRPRSLSPSRPLALSPLLPTGVTRLGKWRERHQLDKLPRLDTLPQDYKQLADFLDTMEAAVAEYGRPGELAGLALGQMSPSVKRYLARRTRARYPVGTTAQPVDGAEIAVPPVAIAVTTVVPVDTATPAVLAAAAAATAVPHVAGAVTPARHAAALQTEDTAVAAPRRRVLTGHTVTQEYALPDISVTLTTTHPPGLGAVIPSLIRQPSITYSKYHINP
ncbi:hypothetical protein Emed_007652 [Eimeria media]